MSTGNSYEQTTHRWPVRRIILWWILANAAIYWRGPAFIRAFQPDFFPPGHMLFLPDFFQEWASARNFFEGLPIYTPQEITVKRYLGIERDPNDARFMEYNAHPPAAVLLTIPLAWMDFATAFLVWNLVSLAALAVGLWLIVRHLGIAFSVWSVFPAITLLVVCHPFWHQMVHGQLNLILLLLTAGTWAAARWDHPIWAGIFLGSATALKLFPAFLFLYFLARRQWKTAACGVAALAAITAVTAALFGFAAYQTYFEKIVPNTLTWRSDWVNMSVAGFWSKLFDPVKQWSGVHLVPVVQSPMIALVGTGICDAMIIALVIWSAGRARGMEQTDWAFGMSLIAMLLVSPIAWDHYYLLLTLPAGLLWQKLPNSGYWRDVFWVCMFVVWLDPRLLTKHFMILLGAEHQLARGWVSEPSKTLIAVSISFYALLALFVLIVWALRSAAAGVQKTA